MSPKMTTDTMGVDRTPDSSSEEVTVMNEKAELSHVEAAAFTSDNGTIAIDPVKEKALVRKIDLHVIPLVMGLYLMSFIDR